MKLAICGHGQAGKDTAANWFAAHTCLRFAGSTSEFLVPYVVAARHGLSLELARAPQAANLRAYEFAHRHSSDAKRAFWKHTADVTRTSDLLFLVRPALATGDILCGCRDHREIVQARAEHLIDRALWIENPRVRPDPTLTYDASLCDDVIVNAGSLADFHELLQSYARQHGLA